MSLGVGELAERDRGAGTGAGPKTRVPPRALGLGQSGLDVRHFDIEGDLAVVAWGTAFTEDPHVLKFE
jgi:hypothetical protein